MPSKAKLTTRERTTSNVSSDNLNKGSELSHAEADSNFINLRDQSIAISDGSTTTDIEAGETITFSGASVSGNTVTITGGGGGSGLGAHLEVKDNTTIHAINTNDDLTLEANGTGDIVLQGNVRCTGSVEITNSITTVDNVTVTGTVTANDFKTGQIDIDDNIIQTNLSNANLELKSNGTGNVIVNQIIMRDGPGSGNQIKTTSGEGLDVIATDANLMLKGNTVSIASSLHVGLGGDESGGLLIEDNTIKTARSSENLELEPLGNVQISGAYTLPKTDGSANQVLQTDGSGTLSFATISSASTGNLSMSAQTITGTTSNGDIIIAPQGTGSVQIQTEGHNGGQLLVGDGGAGAIGSNGDEDLQIGVDGGDGSKARILFLKSSSGGHIKIEPDSGGKISMLGTLTGDTTSEAGNVRIEGVQIGHDAKITTYSSNQDLEIDASGTGAVSILTQKVMMTNLPTSNPNVAGQLYNDSGTLKISAG